MSTLFRGARLIRGEALISMLIPKGAALIRGQGLFDPALIRGNTVFERMGVTVSTIMIFHFII